MGGPALRDPGSPPENRLLNSGVGPWCQSLVPHFWHFPAAAETRVSGMNPTSHPSPVIFKKSIDYLDHFNKLLIHWLFTAKDYLNSPHHTTSLPQAQHSSYLTQYHTLLY